jgi:hypothetical protein
LFTKWTIIILKLKLQFVKQNEIPVYICQEETVILFLMLLKIVNAGTTKIHSRNDGFVGS